jgi:hypothetical protein
MTNRPTPLPAEGITTEPRFTRNEPLTLGLTEQPTVEVR